MYVCVKPRCTLRKSRAEVSSFAPHLLHTGPLVSATKWRYLLRVLCPVRRPITTLDCFRLQDKNLVFVVRLGPTISFRACLCALQWPRHINKCWLSTRRFIFLFMFCLQTPKHGWGHTNLEQNQLLRACRWFRFLVPQHVQGPNTAPLFAPRRDSNPQSQEAGGRRPMYVFEYCILIVMIVVVK